MKPKQPSRDATGSAQATPAKRTRRQRGGFAIGLVAGLLIGLALALGVALYITKAPIPFVNKVPLRTAEQDTAETARNRNWDPNAPLAGKAGTRAANAASAASAAAAVAASGAVTSAPAPQEGAARPATRDAAAILAGGIATSPAVAPVQAAARANAPAVEPFVYFVQAGAFTRPEDAEQQRAKLALMGQTAKVTEREQAGRTVHRVRVGPFAAREEADGLQVKLQEQGFEAQIVRVERP